MLWLVRSHDSVVQVEGSMTALKVGKVLVNVALPSCDNTQVEISAINDKLYNLIPEHVRSLQLCSSFWCNQVWSTNILVLNPLIILHQNVLNKTLIWFIFIHKTMLSGWATPPSITSSWSPDKLLSWACLCWSDLSSAVLITIWLSTTSDSQLVTFTHQDIPAWHHQQLIN